MTNWNDECRMKNERREVRRQESEDRSQQGVRSRDQKRSKEENPKHVWNDNNGMTKEE